jgi:hypothetical protein
LFQRLSKSVDGVLAKACLPALFDVDEKLTICVLGFSTLRREPSNLRPAAGRVGLDNGQSLLPKDAIPMLIASFDTPVRSGMSRSRTPFSSSTLKMLTLIANDKSDSVSNSMANASSTRERSAGSGIGESSLRADARRS